MDEKIYFKRKIYNKLVEWKENSNGKTALLIEGAHSIGKSTIAEEFGKNEYDEYLLIDFNVAPDEIKDLFIHERSDIDLILQKLQSFYGKVLPVRKSLIIFDEVQFCPEARSLIKYLVADGRYDYLETGSLISIKKNVMNIIIPSEEKKINMYPLDFEEFLWALGDTTTIPFLKKCYDNKLRVDIAHKRIMKDFRTYVLIGGMPQAVVEYIQTKSFDKVDDRKRDILKLYHDDINKHGNNSKKIVMMYDNIPSQLSNGSKKYKLAAIDKSARNQNYEDELTWLDEAKIINLCNNVTDPSIGLGLTKDESNYKCYQSDVGLLVTQAFINKPYVDNEIYKAILFDKLNVNEGMIMENFVAQTLKANGYELYYYSKNDNQVIENNMEIDFLIVQDKRINPIEVKSGEYKKHTSIDRFKNKFGKSVGTRYILHTKDLKVEDDVVYLPLYMAMFL
ncbi:MAG: ATP-binding protein [Bacilli bacterium]|nr:ATP-binding protein [Bacilli bacterium]